MTRWFEFPCPALRLPALLRALCILLLLATPAALIAACGAETGKHGEDEHAGHAPPKHDYVRSVASYDLPDVALVAHDGAQVDLESMLDPAHPVFLNFIFTSCTTICPVMSATFAEARKHLGAEADALRMVSISVDPEHDTSARLNEYAGRFGAGSGWKFLTGDLSDVIRVQRAFDAYRDGKLNHAPLTFLRGSGETQWPQLV